ncbi:MAG: hypothetical protein WBF49_13670 [Methyloceanibacter sp.]|jgi:hypothetical protein|uniref:hypothetical protein n=1 Tax=Methyloceanibacter sp. TaxID=1965321 RepID=UPI002CCD72F7|nr:hypothetical protein [Methyloceanibacter sp.]HXE03568.1 hypothetical protein [Methyloceanibacter sp.]
MQASLSRLAQVALLGAALALVPLFARAEPKAPSEEENADAAFAASYIGKNYDGDLDIEGWDDLGGGLIAAPIFIHQYQREDGTYLVITSRQLAKESKDTPANYEVVDALIVPPPQAGVEFTISCVQGKDETLRFIGEAKGPESKEWWTEVRRAWEIALDTGKISSTKTKGVRCTNVSWGQ